MAIVGENFSIYRGDTWTETWTILDQNGVSVDITGATFKMTLKNNTSDADPGVLQLTSPSSGIVITDAATGVVTLTITATQTAALTPSTYEYDIQMNNTGTVKTLVRGKLTIVADVTITA